MLDAVLGGESKIAVDLAAHLAGIPMNGNGHLLHFESGRSTAGDGQALERLWPQSRSGTKTIETSVAP